MRTPGYFIEPGDLGRDGTFTYSNTILFRRLGDDIYAMEQLPEGFPRLVILNINSGKAYTDSLYHWTADFDLTCRETDIIARLQDRDYNYSYATIIYLNRYFNENSALFRTKRSKIEFIKKYSTEEWVLCTETHYFVPKRGWSFLKDNGGESRVRVSYLSHIESRIAFKERFVPALKAYSTKATDYFEFKVGKVKIEKPLFLGVELELEGATSAAIKATESLLDKHAIIKRDGSLTNGLEICSAPATLDSHADEFKDFFDNLPEDLSAESSCGMHVHVDRKNLSEFQIGKIVRFIHNQDNATFIDHIAGRMPNSYCRRETSRKVTSYLTKKGAFQKYDQVNLTPPTTIEFRLFTSTVDYTTFLKNLEFCKALVDYTSPAAIACKNLKEQLKHENFTAFVKENGKFYPNLATFLGVKQLRVNKEI